MRFQLDYARQTGLEGQFNRANYDAKTTTVSNFENYRNKWIDLKASFGLFLAVVLAVISQSFVI
jgi:hypothetical protein